MYTQSAKRAVMGALAAALAVGTFAVPAAAADIDAGFTAQAVIPENQINPMAAYFDLRVQPGQEQQLAVSLENKGDTPIVITVETITASTNRNGIIDYSSIGVYDAGIPFLFHEVATPREDEIEIPPYASAEAVVDVKLPEEAFEGQLLGSIRLLRRPEEADVQEGAGIVNQYGYTIGVRLTGEEAPIEAEFSLGDVGISLVNYRAAVVAAIHNPRPMMVEGLAAEARVFRSGEESPVISGSQVEMDMAPCSVLPLTLADEAGYGFAAGEYRAEILLELDGRQWTFEKAFTVAETEAGSVNENALNQYREAHAATTRYGILLCLIGAACLLGLVCALRYRSRKSG